MRDLLIVGLAACLLSTPVAAQRAKSPGDVALMKSAPASSTTVTNCHKQSVYDPSDNKIGEIDDVLIGQDGRVTALVLAVGGFLGIGEKDVLVPFNSVKGSMKDDKWRLVMNTTKDALKAAPGFKYDRTKMIWVPDK